MNILLVTNLAVLFLCRLQKLVSQLLRINYKTLDFNNVTPLHHSHMAEVISGAFYTRLATNFSIFLEQTWDHYQ